VFHILPIFTLLAVLTPATVSAIQPQQTPATSPADQTVDSVEAEYHTHDQLSDWIHQLAEQHPDQCTVEVIGQSRQQRDIHAIRLSNSAEPDQQPALLIVSGIDGDRLLGTEVAMHLTEQLLNRATSGDDEITKLLTQYTLYIIPRVNPDPTELFFTTGPDYDSPRIEQLRTPQPDDQDRDGLTDDDGPDDLNGDGFITMMRVHDPDEADLIADPNEPRLNIKPDRMNGEQPEYTLYIEGIDNDGDGQYNEDPAGGVDLNMNFMHGYRQHADGAGPHQVSEPESLALLQFVLDHQNIAAVLIYGRHDNLVKSPDGKGTYNNRLPKNIDSGDVEFYKTIGKQFREITGLKKVPSEPSDGAFFAWAYAQFGVPSFTSPLLARPEPVKEDDEKKEGGQPNDQPAEEAGDGEDDEGETLTPSGVGDISQETLDELLAAAEAVGFPVTDEMMAEITPDAVERFAKMSGVQIRRIKQKTEASGKAKNAEDAAWLKYSDEQRGGAGFIEWQPFEHPDFGQVEIGGWVPYFKTNPPTNAIPDIVDKQAEFVLDLLGRFPEVSLEEPEVTRLASGLYEIKTALINNGFFPAGTAMARRNQRARPYVVRLSVPHEDIITGRRVNKVWSLAGSGGRETFRWIIKAPDDTDLTITVYSDKYGQFENTITLAAE